MNHAIIFGLAVVAFVILVVSYAGAASAVGRYLKGRSSPASVPGPVTYEAPAGAIVGGTTLSRNLYPRHRVRPPLNCRDEGLLMDWFNYGLQQDTPALICPDCLSHEFYEGPSGGLSTNMYCANADCGANFNTAMQMDNNGKVVTMQGDRIGDSKLTVAVPS